MRNAVIPQRLKRKTREYAILHFSVSHLLFKVPVKANLNIYLYKEKLTQELLRPSNGNKILSSK
jgi:hypothetical protein